jgi:hypothetical protein
MLWTNTSNGNTHKELPPVDESKDGVLLFFCLSSRFVYSRHRVVRRTKTHLSRVKFISEQMGGDGETGPLESCLL